MVSQISNFIGRTVSIKQEGDLMIIGRLRFFNFQDQIIHIENYKIEPTGAVGEFIVLNKNDWLNIQVVSGGKTK